MELAVYNIKGNKTKRTVTLSDSVFGIETNDHAVYLDVKLKMANKRQGTHKTKGRSEITGSTRKIKKQKGTGTARAGSVKSPTRVGGGRAFGPEPRDYGFKLNRKLVKLARKSALTYKAKDQNIIVLEDVAFDAPKTKQYVDLLTNLKVNDSRTLLVLGNEDKNVYMSSKNIQKAEVVLANNINTYDIMKAKTLILTEGSIEKVESLFN